MNRGVATAVEGDSGSRSEGHGRAFALGWRCFLALVALTPLVIGALPRQAGSLSLFSAYDPVSLPKTVAFLVLSGLSLGALCVSVLRGESGLRWHAVLWVLVALLGWAGVSTLFSVSPAASVWGGYLRNEGLVAIFGYGLVVFLAIQYVRSTRDLRTVMAVAVVSGSLVSVYTLLQSFDVDPIEWNVNTSRVFSTFGNADMLGNYLVFALALAVGLALATSGRWPSLRWWFAALLIVSALFITKTRGAWLGALVVLLSLVFTGWHRAWRASVRQKLVLGGLVTVAAAAATVAIASIRIGSVGSSAALSSVIAVVSNGRSVIWLTGLRGWLVHPITGWGPDAFGRAFDSAVGADWYRTAGSLGGSADNAHNLLVQALVTLGVPGLVLTTWALAQTVAQSYRGMHDSEGHARLLVVALWAGLVGMLAALFFGLTTPEVSVWLWLTVGLLLAPTSHPVPPVPRASLVAGVVLGVGVALVAGSWLVADVIVGRALQGEPGPAQVSAIETAARVNPLAQTYRWLVAEALVNQALAERRAGQGQQIADATMVQAISAYYTAAAADRGDVLVRVALAKVLDAYASEHPDTDAAQRGVQVALEARALAPYNAVVLVTLAKAYEAAGHRDEALSTAQLSRSIAPAYSSQALGSLGASTP